MLSTLSTRQIAVAFKVVVKRSEARSMSLHIPGSTPLRTVKRWAAGRVAVGLEQVSFWRNGHTLSDNCLISDLGSSGDTRTVRLQMVLTWGENANDLSSLESYILKIHHGASQFNFRVNPTETVGLAIVRIRTHRHIAADKDIDLWRRGERLDTNDRFCDVGLGPGSMITQIEKTNLNGHLAQAARAQEAADAYLWWMNEGQPSMAIDEETTWADEDGEESETSEGSDGDVSSGDNKVHSGSDDDGQNENLLVMEKHVKVEYDEHDDAADPIISDTPPLSVQSVSPVSVTPPPTRESAKQSVAAQMTVGTSGSPFPRSNLKALVTDYAGKEAPKKMVREVKKSGFAATHGVKHFYHKL